jgi:ribosomal protein uS17
MAKILRGKITSNKMQSTAVVEVIRMVPHPLYKKLLKRSKKYKVETNGQKVEIGTTVRIIETRPMGKGKHFKLLQENLHSDNLEKPVKEPAKTLKPKTASKKEAKT